MSNEQSSKIMTLTSAQIQEIVKGIYEVEENAFESIKTDYEYLTDDITFIANVSVSIKTYGGLCDHPADQRAESSITINSIECYDEKGNDILTPQIQKEIEINF